VIVGRSNIVGKPMAALLIQDAVGANGTVTVCHRHTRDLGLHTRRADILIVAAGRAGLVTGDMIQRGAVVIDAGYNAGNVGDVDYEGAATRAAMITPVPGGVGPMTIAVLLANTVDAASSQALKARSATR